MGLKIENRILKKHEPEPIRVTVPDGVTEIGEVAFAACRSLTDIILPASLEKIADDALKDAEDHTFEPKGNLPVTIHAPKGSYAEEYAEKNHFAYKES